jgi:phosphoserine aminotransferase
MLCVEDYLDALGWADSIGGLKALIKRADTNTALLSKWVERTAWIDFLARNPATRSNTSVCLVVVDSEVLALDSSGQAAFARSISDMLETEGVAFDIAPHRDAPPGLRIWCGATVEPESLTALLPWLDWAHATAKAGLRKAA